LLAARLRLSSLWISQTARVLADWSLRMAAFSALVASGASNGWHLTTALFIAPFIVLAPLNGVLSNGLPRRYVLAGAASFSLLAVIVCIWLKTPWHICLAIVAVGSAAYSAARYAMLPAAAIDSRIPLPRVSGWIEMAAAAAIVLGALLGIETPATSIPLLLLGLNALCLITAGPASFPSDVIRPEPPMRGIADFFRDCGRVFDDEETRSSLLALSAFQAIVTAGSGVLLTLLFGGEESPNALFRPMLLLGIGAAAGCGVASLQGHPRRCLGLVPLGTTGLLIALGWAGLAGGTDSVPCLLLGFMGGLVNVPLRATYLAAVPADARGNATSIMNTTIYVLTTAVAIVPLTFATGGVAVDPAVQLAVLILVSAIGAALAWYVLYAQTLEVIVEVGLIPLYRIRAFGPGAGRLPLRGPLLLVSNHAAYLDPFWIAKVVPRQVRPMMTSLFYDLPVVRWLSRHVARAIRVPTGTFRREAPELQEAIAALRNGECIVIFPEGILRRTEEVPLRQFGRGVWQILEALPDTAVCMCWIEGGWGSYFSYKDGPPGKNKRFDRVRQIDLAFSEPRPLDRAILADHHTTRAWLHRAVLECRGYLGLPVLESQEEQTRPCEETAAEPQPGG
jgi:1-acyl-sn-glycerol-3-phosphate acyltransferase